MRSLVLVVVAGCSFSTSVTPTIDGETITPDAPPDASSDPPLAVCNVGVTSVPGTDRGRVGGEFGGDNFGPLRCNAPADRIVGIGIRLSDNNTLYNVRSAHGFAIACAPVTVDLNTGTGTFGTTYVVEVMGSGQQGWAPSTLPPPTLCPAGMVVNGLQTRTGQNQNIFSNVNFRCGRIDGVTGMTVTTQVVHVADSGTETQNTDTVNCANNEIIYEMSNRTGSGFDSVNLFCAPANCT